MDRESRRDRQTGAETEAKTHAEIQADRHREK